MIKIAINTGIKFLQQQQEKDGSFLSFTTPTPLSFNKSKYYHSTFPATLILSCLNELESTPELDIIKEKTASFLLSQKSKSWTFNYWVRNSSESKTMPYPDDLDVTFCAVSSLIQYDRSLINGKVMAKLVEILTLLEEKEGGPYRTWVVSNEADKVWRDVDPAVNSNIGFFLSLVDAELPNLTEFVEARIKKNNITSPYYPQIYPILYFICRAYPKNSKTQKIADILLSKMNQQGYWENPLNTALAISALLSIGVPVSRVENGIKYLIKQKEGLQKAYSFCIDPAINNTIYYSGSPALTVAFCLEALGKYSTLLVANTSTLLKESYAQKIQKSVCVQVQNHYQNLSKDLNKNAQKIIVLISKMDEKNHITHLPYLFQKALGKNGEKVSNKIIISLGAANLYGWIAYTIYDDFLDGEGVSEMLPVANIALRELTKIFCDIASTSNGFEKLFNSIMDKIENANAWEISNCRMVIADGEIDIKNFKLPKFGNLDVLAHKSLGHALGPLAVLFSLGFSEKSLESKHLLAFFTYYLIARQLNDDAHDWEEDLKKGHITPVGALLLKKIKLKNKISRKKYTKLLPQLQEIFWDETIVDVCRLIENNLKKARKSLKSVSTITDSSFFEELLIPLDKTILQTREERQRTIQFISSYNAPDKSQRQI